MWVKIVMQDCNVHTVLRLPRGTFTPDSQGVKANVVFFQKGLPTEAVWIFDARSNVPGVKNVPTNPKPQPLKNPRKKPQQPVESGDGRKDNRQNPQSDNSEPIQLKLP
ncbi:MAG: N-6 DNA methylase [Planktothrix sp.]